MLPILEPKSIRGVHDSDIWNTLPKVGQTLTLMMLSVFSVGASSCEGSLLNGRRVLPREKRMLTSGLVPISFVRYVM